jgi:hypothetical protein
MHHASATADLAKIDLGQYVIMRQARQTRRVGELLKLAARLIGELPAPRNVSVSAGLQEISLGFDGTPAGVMAMAAWASHYHAPLTGEHTVIGDGTPAVRCTLSFTRDGVTVDAYAYVTAARVA